MLDVPPAGRDEVDEQREVVDARVPLREKVALGARNGSISVSVADTGPGISAAEQDRIFRPFWSRDGAGTGLGLAIARELALALGGRIELQSKPGHGSRFDLVLPSSPP